MPTIGKVVSKNFNKNQLVQVWKEVKNADDSITYLALCQAMPVERFVNIGLADDTFKKYLLPDNRRLDTFPITETLNILAEWDEGSRYIKLSDVLDLVNGMLSDDNSEEREKAIYDVYQEIGSRLWDSARTISQLHD